MPGDFGVKPSRGRDIFDAFHSAIYHYIDERVEQTKRKETSGLVDRLMTKIKESLHPKQAVPSDEKRLAGRISELDQNAGDVSNYLLKVKQALKSEIEGDLINYVDSVMDPMIREVERIRLSLKQDRNVVEHPENSLKKYADWISRAKLWVEICSAKKDKELIADAILEYTVSDFVACIERDLQLISDYQDHLLANLVDYESKGIKESIAPRIAPYVSGLLALTKKPDNLRLENFQQWRDIVEKKRDFFFNVIFQIIDNVVDRAGATSHAGESQEGIIHILQELAYLESEIPVFCYRILNNEVEDEAEKAMLLPELDSFMEQVNALYFDIRMPADVVERLIYLRETLENAIRKVERF